MATQAEIDIIKMGLEAREVLRNEALMRTIGQIADRYHNDIIQTPDDASEVRESLFRKVRSIQTLIGELQARDAHAAEVEQQIADEAQGGFDPA